MREKHFISSSVCAPCSAILAVLLILLDQYAKIQAALYLKGKTGISLIPGVLELKYLYPENRGIAFGMFQGKVILFAVLSVVLLAAIIWFFIRIPKQRYYIPLICVCVLMFSGAVGNLIDRAFRGYVIDFIYFSLIDFPIFNLADVYVVCGGILLVFCVLFKYKEDEDFNFLSLKKGTKNDE